MIARKYFRALTEKNKNKFSGISVEADPFEQKINDVNRKCYFQVTGLDVACKYYFRVMAVTPTGPADYTAPVMKVVI